MRKIQPDITNLNELEGEEWLGLDLETSGFSPYRNKVAVVALAASDGRCFVEHCRGSISPELRHFLEAPRRKFVTHNGFAFDLQFLATHGVNITRQEWYDTMVGEILTLKSPRHDVSASLKATVRRRLGQVLDKDIDHSGWMNPNLSAEQLTYVTGDIVYLTHLREEQLALVSGTPPERAIAFEMGIGPTVSRMSLNGLPLDTDRLDSHLLEEQARGDEIEDRLTTEFGRRINFNSPVQVKALLAERGLKLRDTKAETLEEISQMGGPAGELVQAVLDIRGAKKRQMYGPSWQQEFVTGGLVHSRFWQVGTDTGRFSSSEPNLQQIPRTMRHTFGGRLGYSMVWADYAQIEVRVAAYLSEDQTLIDSLDAEDIYEVIGLTVFGRPLADKEERKIIKAMLFTLLFGGGIKRFFDYARANGSRMSFETAKSIGANFFAKFKGITAMRNNAYQVADHRIPQTITMPTGFQRTLARDKLTATRLLNTVVQGYAAAGLKFALEECRRAGLDRYLGATVHDEFVASVPNNLAREYGEALQAAMIRGMQKAVDVPINVEVSSGFFWGS